MATSARTGTGSLRAAVSPARRWVRRLGTTLLLCGLAAVMWTVTVWLWQDPVTGLYTWYEQRKLSSSLEQQFADPLNRLDLHGANSTTIAAEERAVAAAAARYRRRAQTGQAIGRIVVPRLGVHMVLVNGTDHDSLEKGPGRDERAYMPGQGRLVYVAGHRTTFLAPFSHIERLRRGDRITLEMPYATFVYTVTGHRIVPADDLSVLRSHGREQVELQACHPRFFATHRYIVYGRPVRIVPRGGRPFRPNTPY
jgi:sortase A